MSELSKQLEDAELAATVNDAMRLARTLVIGAAICGVLTAGSAVAIAFSLWTRH